MREGEGPVAGIHCVPLPLEVAPLDEGACLAEAERPSGGLRESPVLVLLCPEAREGGGGGEETLKLAVLPEGWRSRFGSRGDLVGEGCSFGGNHAVPIGKLCSDGLIIIRVGSNASALQSY